MSEWKDTLWCTGCGVEIIGPPVMVGKQNYCCQDCSRGFECSCRSWAEQEEDRRGIKSATEEGVDLA